MLKLGIIGTHIISDQMVKAAQETQKYRLTTVYSRSLDQAQKFGNKYGAQYFYDDLEQFMSSGKFDVVYIASPNSLHFSQAVLAIQNDLNVIVEKPAFVNPNEFSQIKHLLRKHPKSLLIEAARNIHTPIFHSIESHVKSMQYIQGAEFYTMKYSSRYDCVLNHSENYPNIFRLKFAGGALMDMGVYGIYAAVTLFGDPLNVEYNASLSKETNVDIKGTILLQYSHFNVIINTGKTTNTHNNSEIYGLRDTLLIDSIFDTKIISYYDDRNHQQVINDNYLANTMTNELYDFAELFSNPHSAVQVARYKYWLNLSSRVNLILYRLRKSANIIFPSDN